MVEMAKAHNLNIYKYLTYLLEQRPSFDWNDDQFEKLAPWSSVVQTLCNNNQSKVLAFLLTIQQMRGLLQRTPFYQALTKKTLANYKKVDLLILDEWLIRPLSQQESYDLLEIVEARCTDGSIIFCTQYEPDDWYVRLNPNSTIDAESGSAITDAIMDRIIHNSYEVLIDGRVSMRERHGLRASATKEVGNHE